MTAAMRLAKFAHLRELQVLIYAARNPDGQVMTRRNEVWDTLKDAGFPRELLLAQEDAVREECGAGQ